jgi:cell division protein FtsB
MRDIGIRIQRYKLRRYGPPETIGERARLGLAIALAAWLIWALFLSDHSAVRLLGLEHKQKATEQRLAEVSAEVKRGTAELKAADDPAVAERILRERHNFAHEGELLYVIQADGSVQRLPSEISPADSAR